MYLQANNALVIEGADIARLFGQYFEAAFEPPKSFAKDPFAAKWHLIRVLKRTWTVSVDANRAKYVSSPQPWLDLTIDGFARRVDP